MNYQTFASYNNIPPLYGNDGYAFYDKGNGIPKINENNMTINDIYRTPFLFLNDHKNNYSKMAETSINGIHSESELSKLYFSDENIKRIQRMIKKEVFNRTKGEFKLDVDQDEQDIFLTMRAVYLENARFMPGQTVRQIKRLNAKVIEDVLPGIITNIRQYYGYQKEINQPLKPIPLPQNVNNKGRLTLPSIMTTYGI